MLNHRSRPWSMRRLPGSVLAAAVALLAAGVFAWPLADTARGEEEPASGDVKPAREAGRPAAREGEAQRPAREGEPAPAKTVPPARIAELIAQLGSDNFQQRDQAQRELVEIGPAAVAALEKAKADSNPERAARAAKALAAIREKMPRGPGEGDRGGSPESLRWQKDLPQEVSAQVQTVLDARAKAVAEANARAADGILAAAEKMELAGKREAAIQLYRLALKVDRGNKLATAALVKAGVEVEGRAREGEGARTGPRDGEGPPRIGPRDGEALPTTRPRDGEGPAKPGPRDGAG